MLPKIRTCLGDPLDLAAFVPVFPQNAHDVMVRSADVGHDPQFLGLSVGLLDTGRRIPVYHFLIAFVALVREAREGVAADDQAADGEFTDLDCADIHEKDPCYLIDYGSG